jgi:diguanylate cyclase (GGDEF)-like protein
MALTPLPVFHARGFLKLLRQTVPIEQRGLQVYRDLLAINELAARMNVARDMVGLRRCLARAFQQWLPQEASYLSVLEGDCYRRWHLSGPDIVHGEGLFPLDHGSAGAVFQTDLPLHVGDAANSRQGAAGGDLAVKRWASSIVVLPCHARGKVSAVLELASASADCFDKIDYHLACLVSAHLSSSLDNILTRQELSLANEQLRLRDARLTELNAQLEALAHTDEATGLYNKRRLMEQLEIEIARSQRYGDLLSCLMLDLDHFKHINDSLGHQAGDDVLRQVGRLLRCSVRVTDFVARYGGEEFTIIMPKTGSTGAFRAAEHVRAALGSHMFVSHHTEIHLTVSIGAACYTEFDGLDAPQIILAADSALYRAKREGRNRVCLTETDASQG